MSNFEISTLPADGAWTSAGTGKLVNPAFTGPCMPNRHLKSQFSIFIDSRPFWQTRRTYSIHYEKSCEGIEKRIKFTRWRHQIKTFPRYWLSEGNPLVTTGFPSQRPVTRDFDVFFDLRLNKRLRKQSRRRWFERHRAFLRHSNDLDVQYSPYWRSTDTLSHLHAHKRWLSSSTIHWTGLACFFYKYDTACQKRCSIIYGFKICKLWSHMAGTATAHVRSATLISFRPSLFTCRWSHVMKNNEIFLLYVIIFQ